MEKKRKIVPRCSACKHWKNIRTVKMGDCEATNIKEIKGKFIQDCGLFEQKSK